ncbi:MAG: hypothetical protein WCH46_11305 [bacterium]
MKITTVVGIDSTEHIRYFCKTSKQICGTYADGRLDGQNKKAVGVQSIFDDIGQPQNFNFCGTDWESILHFLLLIPSESTNLMEELSTKSPKLHFFANIRLTYRENKKFNIGIGTGYWQTLSIGAKIQFG